MLIVKKFFKLILAIIIIFILLIVSSNVPTKVTDEDVNAFNAEGFFSHQKPVLYKDQIILIADIQSRVLDKFPIGDGLPLFSEREPINLNLTRQGLCFDRSRYLDKIYQYYGFKTRHVYILYNQGKHFLISMLTKGHRSHAVTQVLTSRGWLVVDSNEKYLAVDHQGNPITLEHLGAGGVVDGALGDKFWPIIGLYSRNGMFYKPYILVPEINIIDFIENLKIQK
jgi:hypothetical protein